MAVNKVILIGNVGQDPNVRYDTAGKPIVSMSLATSDRAYTNAQGIQVPERTEWHNLVMWGRNAEFAEKYVRKGAQLYVEGKLRYRVWEDKTNIKRTVAEIYVDYFDIINSRRSE